MPRHCDVVFMVVAVEGADVAALVAGHDHFRPPLYVLDAVAGPLWRDFSSDTMERLGAEEGLHRAGGGGFCAGGPHSAVREGRPYRTGPAGLVRRRSEPGARRRDGGQGLVKFCAPIADKMASQTIGAALAFKAGEAAETALRAAFIQAICLKFDMRLTSRPRQAS